MPSSNMNRLPLPNFFVERFRGIKKLWFPKLGGVTLLTGRNGIGKTTVLEAARIWAAQGEDESIREMLLNRAEICEDRDGQLDQKDGSFVKNLFWGRNPQPPDQIVIGPHESNGSKFLKFRYLNGRQLAAASDSNRNIVRARILNASGTKREFGEFKSLTIWDPEPYPAGDTLKTTIGMENELQHVMLGSRPPSTRQIVDYWSDIALTPSESRVLDALNVATKEKIESIAIIGSGHAQKFIAKMEGRDFPAPLMSLGGGAAKIFVVAAAISSCRGGLLFIDEVENGIHHSVQTEFWKMVMRAAHDSNVQVIATTHSLDCVRGFSEAAIDCKELDGILVRIESFGEEFKVITFDQADLEIVLRDNLEVR